jgi:gluconolactonase
MDTNRRTLLASGAAAAAMTTMPRAFAQWQPSQRYPDPSIKIIDPSTSVYTNYVNTQGARGS